MSRDSEFLLYGANGYTAGLIIDLAAGYGLKPVLAGRSEEKIKLLAQQHGLNYRVADLADAAAVEAILHNMPLVLHCAGPFSETALPMQQACLRTGTHYLDITGEVAVFEQGASLHKQAVAKNIMLLSGVGFDVVPTDCMALYLKQNLRDATHLQLAFSTVGGKLSRGTALTAVEGLGADSVVRKNGRLQPVPAAYKTMAVPFTSKGKTMTMTVPWGDLATAYYTTGIPNIETYMAVSPSAIRIARLSNHLKWLLGSRWFKKMIKQWINRNFSGPNSTVRQSAHSLVWGRAWNEKGEAVEARLRGPEGYTLTAMAALLITGKVLNGNWVAGFQTPAGLYGPDLILEIEGVHREVT